MAVAIKPQRKTKKSLTRSTGGKPKPTTFTDDEIAVVYMLRRKYGTDHLARLVELLDELGDDPNELVVVGMLR